MTTFTIAVIAGGTASATVMIYSCVGRLTQLIGACVSTSFQKRAAAMGIHGEAIQNDKKKGGIKKGNPTTP